jgi:hypothetical protein
MRTPGKRSRSADTYSDASPVQLSPGKRTRSESRYRLGGGAGEVAGESAGAGEPIAFPHAAAIQSSVGASIPGSAVVSPEACDERGVPAFTDGSVTHFSSDSPSLHVAAHEATHQYQHAGLTGDAGLGAERHAHEVAGAVASGGPAGSLIGGKGSSVAPAVRDYTVFDVAAQSAANQWKVGTEAKVADDGRTVTTENKHEAYADPGLIAEAGAILRAKKSGVEIKPGAAGPSGNAPNGSGVKSTVKVDYKILSDPANKEYYADCGVSSREVQGPMGTDTQPKGIYKDSAGARKETAAAYDPATYRDEIYMKGGLGTTPASAHAAYNALSAADKDAFDKKHGINRYAAPGVGESFTRRRDDSLGGTGFNWHWGGVIMVAGGDRVTFENYTKGHGYMAKDEEWYFETYGPPTKPGQTWHEQWKSVGGDGKGTTLATATTADPSPFVRAAAGLSTAEVVNKYITTADQGEKMALESEMKGRWMKVTVAVKSAQENPDDVYVVAEHGGRSYRTGEVQMRSGSRNVFWVPLKSLAPVTGKISVKVFDADVISDDMISHVGFDRPFTPTSDNRPFDGAEYHTTVEFDR